MSELTALVPFRSPGRGKTRLTGSLSRHQRAELSTAMFVDVITALKAVPIDRIVVVASGPDAAIAARALDVEVLLDPPSTTSLNEALAHADQQLSAATRGGRGSRIIVAADLPRLTSDDIRELVSCDADVVIAPTRGGGTGGLLQRSEVHLPATYGPDSARRHEELARAAGARVTSLVITGFFDDIDTPDDLDALATGQSGPATSRLLERWAVAGHA